MGQDDREANAIEQCGYPLLVEPLGLGIVGQIRHLRGIEGIEYGVADAPRARPLRMQLGLRPQIENLRRGEPGFDPLRRKGGQLSIDIRGHGERPRAGWSTM